MNDYFNAPYLLDEHPLIIQRGLAKAIGLNEAIVLQRIHFWIAYNRREQSAKHFHDGRYWTYNTIEEWVEEFPFWSEGTIKRIFANLEKRGILIKGFFGSTLDRTKWSTIDYEKYHQIFSPLDQSDPIAPLDQSDPIAPLDQSDLMSLDQSDPMILYTERSTVRADTHTPENGKPGIWDSNPISVNKDPELKVQTREQPLLDQKEKESSAKEKESAAAKIAPNAGENRGWSESRLREVWDGSRGKNAKAMGLCAITYGVQHGLDKFLEYAKGDREQAYKFLGMAIAAQFRDDFYKDKPMRFEQVLSLDPSRNCPAYCGNWLGAAIEAEERKSKPAPATLISKIKSFVPNNLSGWELA